MPRLDKGARGEVAVAAAAAALTVVTLAPTAGRVPTAIGGTRSAAGSGARVLRVTTARAAAGARQAAENSTRAGRERQMRERKGGREEHGGLDTTGYGQWRGKTEGGVLGRGRVVRRGLLGGTLDRGAPPPAVTRRSFHGTASGPTHFSRFERDHQPC